MTQPIEPKYPSYTLVTAAYNEEGFIGDTIQSIIAQTVRPKKWVIVSDGSTDRTDEIVNKNAAAHDFIQLVRITEDHPRNWTAQVEAIRTGYAALRNLDFDFIGNLDADITFEPDYFQNLLAKFVNSPKLGLAGGYIYEQYGGVFKVRPTNSERSVPHAVQFFRRECYDSVGGYLALPHGGPDWHAEVCVQMKGWSVAAFPDLKVLHHRPTGTAGNLLKHRFRQGLMDFSLGSDPAFEFVKCMRRLPENPVVAGAMTRLFGFIWSYISRKKVLVSQEFVEFLRRDQRERLRLFPR
jgi:biofilm PGA synthesis N-glycosyltransferase PgaC